MTGSLVTSAVNGTAAAAGSGSQALWFVSRGSGLVLLILLTVVMALGIATRARGPPPRRPRFVTAELHRTLSPFTVALLGLHVVTAILDPYVAIGWAATAVPFLSPYHRLAIGLGTLAVDCGAAVLVTSAPLPARLPLLASGPLAGLSRLAYGVRTRADRGQRHGYRLGRGDRVGIRRGADRGSGGRGAGPVRRSRRSPRRPARPGGSRSAASPRPPSRRAGSAPMRASDTARAGTRTVSRLLADG